MDQTPGAPRGLRRAAILLLLGWSGLGLLHTAYVMVRPHGLIIDRPPELARALGLPDPVGSRIVGEALELMVDDVARGAGPVLLVHPDSAERPAWDYVHYQAAHLSYPRRVDLVSATGSPPLATKAYTALLAPPGVAVDPHWAPRREGAGLVLYTPVTR
jgi:hypothetical protein